MICKYYPEIIYWVISIGFIFLASFIAYLIQTYIFIPMLPETLGQFNLQNYRWLFSVIVLLCFLISLYIMVKQQANNQYIIDK
jgi:heme/copper-type cytochrome/quinol oxidase subunit 4